jgi:hypothetical protein
MVQISRWSFINEIQFKFETLDPTFTVPMKITWRTGSGDAVLSEGFSVKLNDVSGGDKPCKDVIVEKSSETRDFTFAVDAWKYDEMSTSATHDSRMRRLASSQMMDVDHINRRQ